MANSKEEQIFIGIDDQVVELTGADKQAFLEQRAKDQAELDAQKTQAEQAKALKIAAYTKLGLTEEEINAIL
jgi:multidrug efflux pump subunit AcrA (membrane-fusion protein)